MTDGLANPAPQPPRLRTLRSYKWTAFIVVALGTLVTTLDGTIVFIAYPALSATFQVDASVVAWISIAYSLGTTSLLLTMGWVGDALGRERVYLLGLLVFTVPMALVAFSQNIAQLIVFRAAQGVGAAMILATMVPIVTEEFPPRQRGLAFGLIGAVVGIGLGSGPPLGGLILDVLDWRGLFYTRIPLGAVALVMGWLLLKRGSRLPGPLHLDIAGTVLLSALLGSFLLAVSQTGRLGIGASSVVTAWVLSAVLFPLFVFRETRARRPIVDLSVFRNPAFSRSIVALLAHYQAWIAVIFLMPFIMVNGMGFAAARAGLILGVFAMVRSLASPVSGWLTDRVGHRFLMSVGLLVMAAGLLMLSRIGLGVPTWQIVGVLAFASIGSALFDPPNATSIMGAVPATRLGMAGASIATARHVGMSMGIALAGAILSARQAHYLAIAAEAGPLTDHTVASALIRGASDALMVSAVICALGVLRVALGGWRHVSPSAVAGPVDNSR